MSNFTTGIKRAISSWVSFFGVRAIMLAVSRSTLETSMPEVTAATDAISAAVILQRGALLRDTLARDDAVLAHSFRVIVNELGELLRIIAEYNKLVSLQVSFLDEEDQPTSDAVKEWREQARGLDEEAREFRDMLALFRTSVTPIRKEHDPTSQIIVHLYGVLDKQIVDLIDRLEDISEMLALVAHEPFRNELQTRLREAGVA